MVNKLKILALSLGMVLICGSALAAETTVGGSVARGEGSTMAYTLSVRQSYEPWLSGEMGSLQPTAELAGFAWVDDDDTVWGGSLAPGLRFTMFTSANFQPYMEGSVGGAVISDDKFDSRDLGSNALFKTKGIVGVQFGESMRHSVQGEYTNYSTWGLTSDDDGYSTVGVSYGFSF